MTSAAAPSPRRSDLLPRRARREGGPDQPASRLIPFARPFLVLFLANLSPGLVSNQNVGALVLNVASGVLARDGREARVTPAVAGIVIGIFGHRGAVSRVELLDATVTDRHDGGPLTDAIGVRLFFLRPVLARLGLGVILVRSGWLMAGEVPGPLAGVAPMPERRVAA